MTTRSILRQTVPLVLAMGLVLSLLVLLQGASSTVEADGDIHQADIVVDFGDGRVIVRHITFTEPITGLTALRLAGLDVAFSAATLCGIESSGCPAADCFCGCPPPYDPCVFWNYWHWVEGVWRSDSGGVGAYFVPDGGVEGYAWGEWGTAPPLVTAEILSARAALDWLRPQQLANGSYGNSLRSTLYTLLAVTAAGGDADKWRISEGNSLLDYTCEQAAQFADDSAARAGMLSVGVAAASLDPTEFKCLDLADTLMDYYNSETGALGWGSLVDQTWGMLGWCAAGETVPATATSYLKSLANPSDGGWALLGPSSDVDMTALALQALVAADEPLTSTAVISGLAFLSGQQEANGGFLDWQGSSNTNSTAFAVQGLLATEEDPLSAGWASVSGTLPVSYLLTMQLPGGSFAWADLQQGANVLATQQTIPALVGRPFPFLSRGVALRRAVGWMRTQQQADGSFSGANPRATIDAVLALSASGYDPLSFVSTGGKTPLDYLATQAPTYILDSAAAAGEMAAGVVAAGGDPRDFAGQDLVAGVTSHYSSTTGAFGSSALDQAWSMLGLAAAGETVPISATQYLEEIRASDGGWGSLPEGATHGTDPDSTSLALQALAAAGVGRDSESVHDGLAYLRVAQNGRGGFQGPWDTGTNPSSTGLVLQALAAYGEDPKSLHWTRTVTDGSSSRLTLHNPLDTLVALQTDEGGFPGFSGPNDPGATYQAVPGIAGRPLPLWPIPVTDVSISAETEGDIFGRHTFESTVPMTATRPITYVWEATGQFPMVHAGAGWCDEAVFTWNTPGAKHITVTVSNLEEAGTSVGAYSITIKTRVYLPLTMRG